MINFSHFRAGLPPCFVFGVGNLAIEEGQTMIDDSREGLRLNPIQ